MEQIQRISCGTVNCYLVSQGKNAVLVDTGEQPYRQKVLRACKPFDVCLLILTHGHVDHAENAAFLSQTLQIPVAMHESDVDLLSDNRNQSLQTQVFLGRRLLAASMRKFEKKPVVPFTPSIFLKEGDRLEEYGVSARVMELPGHTKGSIGIEVSGHALLVGDALMNMFYPTVSMLYHDREQMVASVERIEDLGKRTIYFGHGRPVENRRWI